MGTTWIMIFRGLCNINLLISKKNEKNYVTFRNQWPLSFSKFLLFRFIYFCWKTAYKISQARRIKYQYKGWCKKNRTHICSYYIILVNFCGKSFKSAKSRHHDNSKLVRQVYIVQKIPPGSLIKHKKIVCENTIFVKKNIAKKDCLLLQVCHKICWLLWKII